MAQPIAERAAPVSLSLPISSIVITGRNWRTDFDETDLQSFAADIMVRGVLNRLWVQTANGDGKHKLIAGERRLRAATIAGLTEVPCDVYDVDDATAEELMVVENLQRTDLHELDYADGFRKMIDAHGYSIAELAKKVNKSETVIRELLHLVKLPESARQAFRNGAISKSICVLIGTIPDETRRAEFAKDVLHPNGTNSEPLTFRRAKELKERSYMKELKGAPFPLDDPTLDPPWGFTCLTCPYYNGNTPKQWQGKRADICLMPDHYRKLQDLNAERKLAKVKAADKTGLVKVLPPQQGEKLFVNGRYLKYAGEFVDVARETVSDYRPGKKNVPAATIVQQAKLAVTVTTDSEGAVRTLVNKKALIAAAKSLGIKTSYSSANSNKPKPSVSEKKREAAAKCRTVAATALLNKVRGFNWTRASVKQWRELALVFFQNWLYGDGQDLLLPILGSPAEQALKRNVAEKWMREYVAKLKTVSEIHGLMAACVVSDRLETYTTKYSNGFEAQDLVLAKLFGVDLKALQTKAAKELAAAEKVEGKKAAKKTVKKATKR